MKEFEKLLTIIAVLFVFGFYQAAAPNLNAQTLFKVGADEQPSGGSSQSSSSNEGIYIAAGVIVAAIVGYTLYKRFSKTEEKDTSSNSNSSLNQLMQIEKNTVANNYQEFKEKIPVDLFFGIKNHSETIPDRTYSIGIGYRF